MTYSRIVTTETQGGVDVGGVCIPHTSFERLVDDWLRYRDDWGESDALHRLTETRAYRALLPPAQKAVYRFLLQF